MSRELPLPLHPGGVFQEAVIFVCKLNLFAFLFQEPITMRPSPKRKLFSLSATGCVKFLQKDFNVFIQISHIINEYKVVVCGMQGKALDQEQGDGDSRLTSTK